MSKYKVGDEVVVNGRANRIGEVSGDRFWVEEYPRDRGYNPYCMEDCSEIFSTEDTPTVSELGEMMGMDPLKELNNLTTHPTGAVREPKEGKGKQHYLLVGFPYTLTELAKHMENPLGRNWEQGLPVSSYADAALRHLIGFLSGDPEPHHLRAAIWNMMCMSETVHRVEIGTLPEEVDDVDRERRSWMNGEDSNANH